MKRRTWAIFLFLAGLWNEGFGTTYGPGTISSTINTASGSDTIVGNTTVSPPAGNIGLNVTGGSLAIDTTTGPVAINTIGQNSTTSYGITVRNGASVTATANTSIYVAGGTAGGAGTAMTAIYLVGAGIPSAPGAASVFKADGLTLIYDGTVRTGGLQGNNGIGAANGNLTLTNSTITSNRSTNGNVALYNTGSIFNVRNTTISVLSLSSNGLLNANQSSFLTLPSITNLDHCSITTSGDAGFGMISSIWFASSTAPSTITATDVQIVTQGSTASSGSVFGSGIYGSVGAFADGGTTITMTRGSILTTGNGSAAIQATNNGIASTSFAGGIINMSGTTLTTQGNASYGAFANVGGQLNLTSVIINTSGTSADGIHIAASDIVNAPRNFPANGTIIQNTVTTTGNSANGLFVDGIVSGTSSTLNVSQTPVTTSGASSFGASVSNGAIFNISNSSIQSSGAGGGGLTMTSATVGAAGTASFNTTPMTALNGPGIVVSGGTATVNLGNRSNVISNGTWLNVSRTSLAVPAIANVTVDLSSLTGAAFTAAGDTGNVTLRNSSQWVMTGSSNLSSLTNTSSGIVFTAPSGGAFKTLTTNNYASSSGTLAINSFLGTDGSPSDVLVIDGGAATGVTSLTVSNAGGLGAYTTLDGILVVNVINGGTTAPGSFVLASPVLAGPYQYNLFQGTIDPEPYKFYLRSQVDNGQLPGPPALRTETALYPVIPALEVIYGRALMDTLHERIGEENLTNKAQDQKEFWTRIITEKGRNKAEKAYPSLQDPKYHYNLCILQLGLDLYRNKHQNGSFDHGGLYYAGGYVRGDVWDYYGNYSGKDKIYGNTGGFYWTHYTRKNKYLDFVMQATRYFDKAHSVNDVELKRHLWSFGTSLEGGMPWYFYHKTFAIEPQAQLAYQLMQKGNAYDSAATVVFKQVNSLLGRVGGRFVVNCWLPHDQVISLWARVNLWHEFYGDCTTLFSSATGFLPFQAPVKGSYLEYNAGFDINLQENLSLYANSSYQKGIPYHWHAFDAKVGVKVNW